MPEHRKKNLFVFIVVFLTAFLFSSSISEARQGCCSQHGGVCGCGCCDGTGLSATCAPYYPECNSAPTPKAVYVPPTPTPVVPTTPSEPAASQIPVTQNAPVDSTPTVNNAAMSNTSTEKQGTDDSGSVAGGLAILALIGGGAWYFNKKNKKDNNDLSA